LGVKILIFFDADPGSGMEKIRIEISRIRNIVCFQRFLHEPTASDAYVGCALFSNIFHIFKTEQGDWAAEKVIDVLPKKVYSRNMLALILFAFCLNLVQEFGHGVKLSPYPSTFV
jgi:hypothetical protein